MSVIIIHDPLVCSNYPILISIKYPDNNHNTGTSDNIQLNQQKKLNVFHS